MSSYCTPKHFRERGLIVSASGWGRHCPLIWMKMYNTWNKYPHAALFNWRAIHFTKQTVTTTSTSSIFSYVCGAAERNKWKRDDLAPRPMQTLWGPLSTPNTFNSQTHTHTLLCFHHARGHEIAINFLENLTTAFLTPTLSTFLLT